MTGRVAVRALKAALTLLALALVFRLLGTEAILSRLTAISPGWAGLAVAVLSLQIVLSALRWQITAGALGLPLDRGRAIVEYYLAVLGNSILPGGVLGDVGRIARISRDAGLRRAAQSVVVERLAGQVLLAAAAAIGAGLWLWPRPGSLVIAAGAALAILAGAVVCRRSVPAPDATVPATEMGVVQLFQHAWFADGIWRGQLALSLAILFCNLGGYWAAAQAVGLTLAAADALFVLPITLAAMLVPVTVNGWGLREGAAAALWPLVGAAAPDAVAASVVFGAAALVAAMPGLAGLHLTARTS